MNLPDIHGNTPLLLAAKLASTGKDYEKVFKFLLLHGADPHIKDANGWSVMDEAVAQHNRGICSEIFQYLHREKMQKWLRNKHLAIKALEKLPDFYMEIRWEFGSSVIPLVSRIAPHDICKFWKYGNSFRIDTTLVGWKNLRSKRRNMSLYFVPEDERSNLDTEIYLVNHSKKVIVHPFEALDPEERSAVIGDIIATEPMQGDVNLLSYKVKPCLNFWKKQVTQKIGAWDTRKSKINYKGQMKYKKKNPVFGPCSESEYFGKDVFDPTTVQFSYPSPDEPVRNVIKKSKAFVWLSENFPFTLQEFLPVLQLIGESNPSIRKLYTFVSSDNFLGSIGANTFPVKIDIPLTFSIKALVTFEKFQLLSDPDAMKIPKYSIQPRKIAQKILTCPKKRLFLANFVI